MKPEKHFSVRDKEMVCFRMPCELSTLIRVKAATERKSISQTASKLLAESLGIDPATIGIFDAQPAA